MPIMALNRKHNNVYGDSVRIGRHQDKNAFAKELVPSKEDWFWSKKWDVMRKPA